MADVEATKESPMLKRLREREAKLKAQIKAEQRKEARKVKALQTRRCQITGFAVLEAIKTDDDLAQRLTAVFDQQTKSNSDRKLLGLAPLKKHDPD